MKKKSLLIYLLFASNLLFAQTPLLKWARQFGGLQSEYGTSIVTDAIGNVYTTGYFQDVVDFDPGPGIFNLAATGVFPSAFHINSFISKLDAAGNFIWAKKIGGSLCVSNAINLDKAGNIFVTGSFQGTVDFDPGPAVFELTATSEDIYICKLDINGNFLWAKQMVGNSGPINVGTSIAIDKDGNVLSAGIFSGNRDFDPGTSVFNLFSVSSAGYLVKLNPSGDFIWAKKIGEGVEEMQMTSDLSGNIYSAGSFNQLADFDPGAGVFNLNPVGSNNTFISKLDLNGNFLWAKQIATSRTGRKFEIDVDNAGNVYVPGSFQGTVDFDPGTGIFNLTGTGRIDLYILKLNTSGNFIWVKQIGGPGAINEAGGIAVDLNGNVYASGNFSGTSDFNSGTPINLLTALGQSDIFLLKLSSTGDFVWAKNMGAVNCYNGSTSLHLDAIDNIYTTGYFLGVTDFDPGLGVLNFNAIGDYDVFVQKLSQCTNITNSLIDVTTCNSYVLNSQQYDSSGIFIQIIPNTAGCDSIITLNLTINRKFTSVNPSICQGQSYFAGGANQTTTGIYKDTLLTSLGCDSIITTNLTVTANLKPNLGPDRNLCSNGSASITPGLFNSYLWQDNSTQPSLLVSNSGKYWVTVTDANNCSATDTLTILAIDAVPKNFLPADQLICYGINFNITVPGYKNYLWSTGDISSTVAINNPGTYYLSVTDNNNCTGKDTVVLQRNYNCIPVNIPNAFTPNKDGTNDTFKPIITREITNYSFAIFNRYGQKIFATNSYSTGWDGTFKGIAQPRNSYIYILSFKDNNGELMEYKGTVTLIR